MYQAESGMIFSREKLYKALGALSRTSTWQTQTFRYSSTADRLYPCVSRVLTQQELFATSPSSFLLHLRTTAAQAAHYTLTMATVLSSWVQAKFGSHLAG